MSKAAQEANAYVREYAERWHIGGDQLTELYGLAGRLGLLMSKDVADRCAEMLARGPPPVIIPCNRKHHECPPGGAWCSVCESV